MPADTNFLNFCTPGYCPAVFIGGTNILVKITFDAAKRNATKQTAASTATLGTSFR
ncbi:hypothetical protein [Reyranella sp.]|uniref:hypothetical protein n=1 Tax=Reyranella sp. TaxID=1929291 RepID=UPI003D14E643